MPFAKGLCREERLECLCDDFRGHAGTSVRHAHRNILTYRQILLARRAFIQPLVRSLNRQFTAVGHRIASIDTEVQNGIFELVRINQDRPHAARADNLDLNARTHGPPDKFLESADELISAGWAWIKCLAPGEGQETVSEGGSSLECAVGYADSSGRLLECGLVPARVCIISMLPLMPASRLLKS